MVVAERAVKTGPAASSALATDARLTRPTAANPNVHLLTFIYFLLRCCLWLLTNGFMRFSWGKTSLPAHQNGALRRTLGKRLLFDNKFFWLFFKGFPDFPIRGIIVYPDSTQKIAEIRISAS